MIDLTWECVQELAYVVLQRDLCFNQLFYIIHSLVMIRIHRILLQLKKF